MATVFSIEDVVDVIIAIGDRPVTSRDFGTPVILTTTNVFSDQVTEITNISSVASAGISTSSPLYKMVSNVLGKTFSPKRVLIAKRALTDFSVNFTVANSSAYTVNVVAYNTGTSTRYNKSFTYTSDSSATNTEIATGLAALIEADSDIGGLVAASNSSGVLVIAPTASAPLSVGIVTANGYVTETSSETAATGMDNAFGSRQDFFYVLSTDQTTTTILALANWAESNKRGYFVSSAAADVYASGSSDVLSQLQAFQYNNTVFTSSLSANTDFPDAALVSVDANTTPGASDLYAKTLTGSAISNFTSTQVSYVKDKGGNVYINRGGSGWYEPGDTVSGRTWDVTKGSLWLEARAEEAIFGVIKRESDMGRKIPYTDLGIQMIDSALRSVLDQAVGNKFLSKYYTYPPLAEDVSDEDKANRVLNLEFTGELAGGIRTVQIRGYLVLSL